MCFISQHETTTFYKWTSIPGRVYSHLMPGVPRLGSDQDLLKINVFEQVISSADLLVYIRLFQFITLLHNIHFHHHCQDA